MEYFTFENKKRKICLFTFDQELGAQQNNTTQFNNLAQSNSQLTTQHTNSETELTREKLIYFNFLE